MYVLSGFSQDPLSYCQKTLQKRQFHIAVSMTVQQLLNLCKPWKVQYVLERTIYSASLIAYQFRNRIPA